MRVLGFCVHGIADMNEREDLTSEFKGYGVISPINLKAPNEWNDLLLFRLYCRRHPYRCWGERPLSHYGKDNGGEKNGRLWLPQQESQKEMMFTWCPPGGGQGKKGKFIKTDVSGFYPNQKSHHPTYASTAKLKTPWLLSLTTVKLSSWPPRKY